MTSSASRMVSSSFLAGVTKRPTFSRAQRSEVSMSSRGGASAPFLLRAAGARRRRSPVRRGRHHARYPALVTAVSLSYRDAGRHSSRETMRDADAANTEHSSCSGVPLPNTSLCLPRTPARRSRSLHPELSSIEGRRDARKDAERRSRLRVGEKTLRSRRELKAGSTHQRKRTKHNSRSTRGRHAACWFRHRRPWPAWRAS